MWRVVEDLNHITTLEFKNENDLIVIIGSFNVSIGGSSYLKYKYDRIEGPLATFSKESEEKVQNVCLEAIHKNIINSAHDLSDGGLAVTISESVISSKNELGAYISIESKLREEELLFGECGSVIVVSIAEKDLYDLVLIAKKYDINTLTIGHVTSDSNLKINESINIDKDIISNYYYSSLQETMNSDDDAK